jgi:pimeloyl-ACP methyl ester carboxylesterase
MPTDLDQRDVTFPNGAVTLAGSVAVPDRGAPCPGVVMVGGSGPSDRNNDTLFPPIREALVRAGIAVLSYDKRGVGESSGAWLDATMDDLAADSVAALDLLRTQPGVRADAVGLFGHSEGGWVVLRAAVARGELAFVITNSCPGMSPAAQDRHAMANMLRQGSGAAEQEIDAALALYDRLIEAGRRGADFAEATRLVDGGGNSSIASYWTDVDERVWDFLKRKQDHDPIPDARRLRCPHLALFGGADQLVPVADSIQLFSAATCHPDRRGVSTLTVEVFPEADHRIRLAEGGRFAPGYLPAVVQWIRRQTSTSVDGRTDRRAPG